MDVNGDERLHPLRCGFPVCDTVGGLNAAFAIMGALYHRERTGEGQFIDIAMLDSIMPLMGWVAANLLIGGVPPVPMGNDNFTAAPSGVFATQDGYINIAANQQEQWESVCDVARRARAEDRRAVPEARRAQGQPRRSSRRCSRRSSRSARRRTGSRSSTGRACRRARSSTSGRRSSQPQIAHRGTIQTVAEPGIGDLRALQPHGEVREDAGVDRRAAAAPLRAHRRDSRRPRLHGRGHRRAPPEGSRLTHGHDRRTEDPRAGLGPRRPSTSATSSSRPSTWRCRTRTRRSSSTSSSRSSRAPASSRRSGTRRRSPSSSITACRRSRRRRPRTRRRCASSPPPRASRSSTTCAATRAASATRCWPRKATTGPAP